MSLWYYGLNGDQHGPVDENEIRAMLASGMINGQTIVWRDGMAEWLPIAEVPEWASQLVTPGAPGSSPGQIPGPMQAGVPMVPTNGTAIASMVCGISSLVLLFSCFIGIVAAVPAVICGHIALGQIRDYVLPMNGKGFAIAGLWTGYVTIAITLIGGIGMGVMIARDIS